MKLQRFSLIILTSVILGLSFSSCDAWDYYWTPGTLDYSAKLSGPPNGNIKTDFTIDNSWVTLRNSNSLFEIRDIRFTRGEIEIKVYDREQINELYLSIDGTNVSLPFPLLQGIVRDNSPEAQNFLSIVVDRVNRFGYARILVDGSYSPRIDFDINFIVDLDVYVRE